MELNSKYTKYIHKYTSIDEREGAINPGKPRYFSENDKFINLCTTMFFMYIIIHNEFIGSDSSSAGAVATGSAAVL